ncbi:sensor histidine kinase [Pedobacter sp. PWIIR3]
MESRIFHSISICLIALNCFYVPYNFCAGLYVGSISALIIALFFTHQYYYSRFEGRKHSNTLFGLVGLIIFGVNYFTNSGINGSTDLIWPVYLLLVFAISPYRQHLKWLLIYMTAFLAIHVVEYQYPFLVRYPFTAGRGQFIDRITAFPIPVIAIFIIIKFIRRSYDIEKRAAEEKTIAIEKNNEQISLQKAQLEKSNMEKSKLMSIISHDLRTPLMHIQNYLELLADNGVDKEDRLMLENSLLKATNGAADMLSNLLNWSKSQMEGSSVHLTELDLLPALLATLEMERTHAAKKDIGLYYDIPPYLMVLADPDMLQLVVRNLISNSVKFTPQGGLINVDAKIVGDECKISIRDNGKGIDLKEQEKIFSIKAEHTYGTNNERGVGLGLVLCKEFIERQGGRIDFESKPGIGSSFFIFIPRLQ